ncbi:MAG: cupin domain-containing protein [Nitrospiraceae bacterium]|nr:cupin domain-containing protein [Nitrospiraceae bacterium]
MKEKKGSSRKKRVAAEKSFCDLSSPIKDPAPEANRSAFYRHRGDLQWSGVRDEPYKTVGGEWAGIVRRVLIGNRGESGRFHVRYFEIAPGGRSSLEWHRHEHVVICVKGRGSVRFGAKRRVMDFMDTLYIAPGDVHQLMNPHEQPFGFLCIVNARRDRPKVIRRKRGV